MESTNANPPPVHVIVRLPYNRPPNAPGDPLPVIWTAEKERQLWDALSSSQTMESRGIDWQQLSQRLATPLPYLLYRAQARYEEGLKGLQSFKGALNPTMPRMLDENARQATGLLHRVLTSRTPSAKASGESTPTKTSTPPPPSPRTMSSKDVPHSRAIGDHMSESTATLAQRPALNKLRPSLTQPDPSPSPSSGSEGEDEDEDKDEEEERIKEESEQVGRRLKELEAMMSSTMLGFARQPRSEPLRLSQSSRQAGKKKVKETLPTSEEPPSFPRGRQRTKPPPLQESIPSIPSPPAESRSPGDQSRGKSVSQTSDYASSPTNPAFRGKVPLRYGSALGRTRASEMGSGQGSNTSSFSDISGIPNNLSV
ncbi:hypothetical protein FRC02_008814 [Tulasnella sp. 418]|nr:hypothetical protein FRC02_008814 [Tulasnella sp. 418]